MARTPQPGTPRKKQLTRRPRTSAVTGALGIARPDQFASVPLSRDELDQRLSLLTESNRQLRRKIFDLYTVFEISRNIAGTLETRSLIDSFLLTCLGQMSASRATIFLRPDHEPDHLKFTQVKGLPAETFTPLSLAVTSPLLQHLEQLNRPLELRSEQLSDEQSDERTLLGYFTPGVIVPLVYKSRLIGLFLIGEKFSRSPFSVDDMEFLSVLANQIAVALQNAQLYENERRATTLLRETQQALVQSEKLAALGEMSARVAHEVNNPLGIIKNYLLLLRKGQEQDREKTTTQYLEIVDHEIDRIAGIVRQLLEFHRPQPVQLRPVDLREVSREIAQLMERPLQSGRIALTLHLPESPVTILGAAEQLRQVLLNLIINARDALLEAGQDDRTISVRLQEQDNKAELCIEDSGPGIPPELREKVFEPFVTTKGAGQGTGLGLAVCVTIVKSHRGSISYERRHERSCFRLLFPLCAMADPAGRAS